MGIIKKYKMADENTRITISFSLFIAAILAVIVPISVLVTGNPLPQTTKFYGQEINLVLLLVVMVGLFSANAFLALAKSGLASVVFLTMLFLMQVNTAAFSVTGTGLTGLPTFQFFAFFLRGRHRALIWTALLMVTVGLISFGSNSGILPVTYTINQYFSAFTNIITFGTLFFIYEKSRDRARREVLKQNKELDEANSQLKEQIHLQEETQNQLKAKIDELNRTNSLMVGRELKMAELKKKVPGSDS